MATYTANVRVGGKTPTMKLTVEASNISDARRLFEAQYGKANVTQIMKRP